MEQQTQRMEIDGFAVSLFRSKRDGMLVLDIDSSESDPKDNDEGNCPVFRLVVNELEVHSEELPPAPSQLTPDRRLIADALTVLREAHVRIQIANDEGNNILSAWRPAARRIVGQLEAAYRSFATAPAPVELSRKHPAQGTQEHPRPRRVVLVGNPIDGMAVYGPFDNANDALNWAETEVRGGEPWISVVLHEDTPDGLTEDQIKARHALHNVMAVIEETYPHDDQGRREDGDSPVSGADVVDHLCLLQGAIIEALQALDPEYRVPEQADSPKTVQSR
jgi:hypothetical protein